MILSNQLILITGLASQRSLAYAIAKECHNEGAQLILTYQNERLKERAQELAQGLNVVELIECDVTQEKHLANLKQLIHKKYENTLHGLLHSIAFAPSDQLQGDLIDVISKEGYLLSHEISAYSFCALTQALKEALIHGQGSVLTLTYLGAVKAIPHYNVMGLAKASLEAAVRYLAANLGQHQVRVNGLSCGPMRTLAAQGIKGFKDMYQHFTQNNMLKRGIEGEEIGTTATFLLSKKSSCITGQILYADAGYSEIGLIS